MEVVGWLGTFFLAICAIPEVWRAISEQNSPLSWYFLIFWLIGEVFLLVYTILKSRKIKLLPLFFNYGLNILCICAIIGYKI